MCAFGRAATDIPGPVLMRFMFESVNRIHETMIYRPDTFRDAWIHFVSLIREPGANNVEFIFHPNSGNDGILGRWYPGDEYVDWLGCSLFNPQNIQDCARTAVYALLHDKPFGVVESAPTSQSFREKGVKTPGVWHDWFTPYFTFVRTHTQTYGYSPTLILTGVQDKVNFLIGRYADTILASGIESLQRGDG